MAAMVPGISSTHNDQRERSFGAFLRLSLEMLTVFPEALRDYSYLIGWDWVT